ncbi:glucose-1-phosphate thymidylyltransferase RfbA [Hippea maritima]|uniref:Glucose-1-phosphate thymidylyltransferase n=1 Tax=Hippea maritima (strain ATCC 700847 / DSM 10411 / MH2) TaxID=760142 RepID=F2LUY0_HIPMA|nr:glucose-1-phosphate thymidylyltransferase RfbA [Hippea maritima]AEA34649.1 glucose-1-phosphate thymidylyltransferase [Hippea maritima DSM 10411]
MKGIILAGGSGTRLYPITKGISKQLLPLYDKPMIYYPLSVLMLSGIKDILIISNPEYIDNYKMLFGDGSQIELNIEYKIQNEPRGLAEAFIIGEEFIGNDDVCLVLGDNVFFGHGLTEVLKNAVENIKNENKATVFGYYVNDPERYGVVEFDENGKVISIEEKPKNPKSNYAVVGLYFYPNDVIKKAHKVKPSDRGELEITSINEMYLKEDRLKVELLGRGYAWFDTGTHDSLLDASDFIRAIEKRTGLKVGCIEEIAYLNGWIDKEKLKELATPLKKTGYGQYLLKIAKEGKK